MDRRISTNLDHWLADDRRRPVVLRGARQVGKTWLIRDLGLRSGRTLVEINLERDPGLSRCFASNDPRRVLSELSLAMDCDITPDASLLFLDEIQAVPELFAKLRWFAEELPALPVAAAGSLLEFTLTDKSFSVPVGRIGYLHVEPMGYAEYLRAHGQARLLSMLETWNAGGRGS
jgi:predicted AAA+ superfamily ATPase